MTAPRWFRVGHAADIPPREGRVALVGGREIAVFNLGDRFLALDNRCPHLGFPLHKGSIRDGILTCHWHHARFDLTSGCTFDLWADDVPTAEVRIENGAVWVGMGP